MAFDSRSLRHRITIERPIARQNADGTVVTSWLQVAANVPAQIVPLSVREFITSQSVQSGITTRIVIRYRAGLDAAMRILHNGRIYNPQGWLADADSGIQYLTAPCSEGLNEG